MNKNQYNDRIVIEGIDKFNSIEKLHKFLTSLIDEGKGDFEIKLNNSDYTDEFIEEVRIYNDKKSITLY